MHIFWTVQKFSLTCGLIDSLFTRYAAVKWQLYHHASQKKVLHAQVAALTNGNVLFFVLEMQEKKTNKFLTIAMRRLTT